MCSKIAATRWDGGGRTRSPAEMLAMSAHHGTTGRAAWALLRFLGVGWRRGKRTPLAHGLALERNAGPKNGTRARSCRGDHSGTRGRARPRPSGARSIRECRAAISEQHEGLRRAEIRFRHPLPGDGLVFRMIAPEPARHGLPVGNDLVGMGN